LRNAVVTVQGPSNPIAGATGSAVEVGPLLDNGRFVGLPLLVSIFTTLTFVFDGFDIQAIAFAAPKLLTEWGIDKAALAPVLAAGLIGMAIGASCLGALGDYLGRKRALIASLSLVAIGCWLSAHASGLDELAIFRLLTGIGLGGCLPNAAALIVEFAPLHVRNVVMSITVVGVPIGGLLGAWLAGALIPAFGWRSIFMVGAILPAILVVTMIFGLAESARFLAVSPARWPQLAQLLNRLTKSSRYRPEGPYHIAEKASGKVGVAALFAPEFRHDTALVWLIFFTNVFAVYAFFGWLPVVISSTGLPLSAALHGALVFNLGGVVGSIVSSALLNRAGSRGILTILGIIAIASTFAAAQLHVSSSSVGLLLAVLGIAGFGINGLQVIMYSVTSHIYPTPCRSSGLGWALGTARLGGILSSYGGSLLLANGSATFFGGISGTLVLTLLGILLLRGHMPARASS
jgi:AAHS family 4-hydroxybenzoate transporter-like MFS transporter